MTTIILTKILLSMKTGASELEKIQYIKKRNIREITKTRRSLQKLLRMHNAIKNCRLCLGLAEKNLFIDEADSNIAKNIKAIFNIEIEENDGKPQYICSTCENTVHKAAELKQIAEVTQWRLEQGFESEFQNACEQNNEDCNYNNELAINVYASNHKDQSQKLYGSNAKYHQKKSKRTNPGPYICETCGFAFKSTWSLKTHRIIHTNNFKYSCGYCSYRTLNRYSLQIHERTHTGDRPYKCVQCRATFTSTSNLASHRRSHLPPSFICDICHKGFKFKLPLLNHIATQHQSAKPFFCSTCENSFGTRKLLRRHERKIHNRPKMRIGATPSYIKAQEEINTDGYNKSL